MNNPNEAENALNRAEKIIGKKINNIWIKESVKTKLKNSLYWLNSTKGCTYILLNRYDDASGSQGGNFQLPPNYDDTEGVIKK